MKQYNNKTNAKMQGFLKTDKPAKNSLLTPFIRHLLPPQIHESCCKIYIKVINICPHILQ